MGKGDIGIGAGLAAAIAVCCGAKLLIFGLPLVAIASGQAILIAAAGIVALGLLGVVMWRRRSGGCVAATRVLPATGAAGHSSNGSLRSTESPSERPAVAAGPENR